VSLECFGGVCSLKFPALRDWHLSCGAGVTVRSVLVDKAAELLGVSRRTVYYRIREGKLQTFRTRGGSQRVLLDSIERLLRGSVDVSGILTPTSLDPE
jgi:excisionase family DNA binding protein